MKARVLTSAHTIEFHLSCFDIFSRKKTPYFFLALCQGRKIRLFFFKVFNDKIHSVYQEIVVFTYGRMISFYM